MASNNRWHVTGDAMAVHRQHGKASTSSSMSIGATERKETIDNRRKRSHSETEVNENTKNTPITVDRFPKYMDCQETLVEMSFVKWLAGFRLECRKISCRVNTELYFGLLNFFRLNIVPEMIDCRYKINKSNLLTSYLEQSMVFFRGYYKTVKKVKGDTLDVIYYDRMSSILTYFIDLKLMSSQRYKRNSSHIKTSSKINTMLFVFLDQKLDYMFDSLFQLYYVYQIHDGSVITNLGTILLPVFKKLLSEHPMPKKINFLTYMRYILCFKLWKKIIYSSPGMADSVKKKEEENLRLLLRGLNVPNDFMSQHEKYNWPNWPKLTMSSNETLNSIQRDLKNVSFVLYDADLLLKKCYKDILQVRRKDIPILLKPIEERCKMLRPDLFVLSGKKVLTSWIENFDDTLKPLIPTTRSCNSLMRKFKFNFSIPSNYVCLEIDNKIDDVHVVPINDDLSKLKHFGEGSENHSLPNIDNFSNSDKKCMEKTNLINSSTNKIIDETNNDKSNENGKSSGDALKTLMATLESFPANVKSEPSEDEMQVNVKISKLSEKHVLYRDDGRFNPTLSNNPSRLNYISEIKSTTHHLECSNSKGSKRNQCPSFEENGKNKKICKIKSEYENNVSNYNPNQIIDSNCHNSNIENSSDFTLNNGNFILENPNQIIDSNCHNSNIENSDNFTLNNGNFVLENPNQIINSNCHNSNIENSSHVTLNNGNFVLENPNQIIDSNCHNSNIENSSDFTLNNGNFVLENPNQIIDSNCHNSNIENSDNFTLNNDNSVLVNPKVCGIIDKIYRNAMISSEISNETTTLSYADIKTASYLFINGELILCIFPNCTNSHHFRVLFSDAEMLRHKFTTQFDYLRYHIQYKYEQSLTLTPRKSWPKVPTLEQLTKRCICTSCRDFNSIVNISQQILHSYLGETHTSKKEDISNIKTSIGWKKRLIQRFYTAEYVEKYSISQMIEEMKRHQIHFKQAWTVIFPVNKYVNIKS